MQEQHSSPSTSLSLKLANQRLEQLFDSYVAGLGGSWPRFFDRLATSFIGSDDSDEIDKAYDNYKRVEVRMEERFEVLQGAAVMAGDYTALELGRGMLERTKEVGQKIREFYLATLHGAKDFEEQVNGGHLTW